MGAEEGMRTTIMTIIGLLATLGIAWFCLNTLLWLLKDKKCEE